MDEDCGDVCLDGFETKYAREDEHDSNCGPLDDGRPCFKEVNAFLLMVTMGTKSSFELFDMAVRESFTLESPGGWEDVHFRGSGD